MYLTTSSTCSGPTLNAPYPSCQANFHRSFHSRRAINRQRRSSHFTDNPAEVRKQAHLKFIIHQRMSLFRAENDMSEKLGKGVRHEEISRRRVKGENNFTAEGFQKTQFHRSCRANSFTRRGGLGPFSRRYPALAPQKSAGLSATADVPHTGLKL
jgi:hypothetical protein